MQSARCPVRQNGDGGEGEEVDGEQCAPLERASAEAMIRVRLGAEKAESEVGVFRNRGRGNGAFCGLRFEAEAFITNMVFCSIVPDAGRHGRKRTYDIFRCGSDQHDRLGASVAFVAGDT